jgi:hypothetical protein
LAFKDRFSVEDIRLVLVEHGAIKDAILPGIG